MPRRYGRAMQRQSLVFAPDISAEWSGHGRVDTATSPGGLVAGHGFTSTPAAGAGAGAGAGAVLGQFPTGIHASLETPWTRSDTADSSGGSSRPQPKRLHISEELRYAQVQDRHREAEALLQIALASLAQDDWMFDQSRSVLPRFLRPNASSVDRTPLPDAEPSSEDEQIMAEMLRPSSNNKATL
ncbi:hypothetical protein BC831DRAFT_453737 [Entophlyctis helioformis]|nr:hypothetical protein BC831DRAFT_453737 [Entophlyctis helioformis]